MRRWRQGQEGLVVRWQAMKTLALPMLAVLLVPTLAGADRAEPQIDLTTDRLDALRVAAKCDDKASPFRPWCIAAAFSTGTAAALPKGKVLVGMTIELEVGKDASTALTQSVSFTALAVGKDGKVKLTMVKPENDDENKAVAESVFNAAAVFKGKAKSAKLPKALADYFKTLKGQYATKKAGSDWLWAGASAARMRKVGAFWVVIEVPKANNGIFATILTEAWE